jgi:hypothetical protein
LFRNDPDRYCRIHESTVEPQVHMRSRVLDTVRPFVA